MNVLSFTHRYWPYRGGSEQYFQETSERLVREGHKVSVITTDAWDTALFARPAGGRVTTREERRNGVTIRRVPVRHFPFAHDRFMSSVARVPLPGMEEIFTPPSPFLPGLWRWLLQSRAGSFDLVHAAPLPFTTILYAASVYARRRRLPLVITPFIHTGEPDNPQMRRQYNQPFQLRLLNAADLLLIQTEAERAFLLEHGMDEQKVITIGMGVNPGEINPGNGARFRKKHGIPDDHRIILHPGTLCRNKGSFDLVEAVKIRHRQDIPETLVCAGQATREFHSFFEAQTDAAQQHTRVLGFVQGEEKRDMFHACDLVALPSRAESYGIVFLEAWLAKKPVIGARAGGVPYVIDEGNDGLLVPFGEPASLRDAIDALLRDPPRAAAMGETGYAKTLREATWEKRYGVFRDALTSRAERKQIRERG